MMVVICDLSPHSARKVRVKACRKMTDVMGPRQRRRRRNVGVVATPCSRSEFSCAGVCV